MDPLQDLVGESLQMVSLRERVRALLALGADLRRLPPVLITGETGTGKGLLALTMHRASGRAAGRFVELNGAAIPEHLVESELFGYERGAFTDARQSKEGLLQAADRGTLFLDEVGLLPASVQGKLLKVLEDPTVRRLGSTQSEPVNVWIICASNEDLEAAVRDQRFRSDLYHRLAVLTLWLPPLRERQEDIDLLAEYALARVRQKYGLPVRHFSTDARHALRTYRWPGNVRELNSVIERVLLLSSEPVITADTLGLQNLPSSSRADSVPEGELPRLGNSDRDRLTEALARTGWNISRTASLLGITRNTVRARIARYGLRERDATSPVNAEPDGGESRPAPAKSNELPAAARARVTATGPDQGHPERKHAPPFVGRTQELGLLDRWLREVAGGQPRVVLVQGEAGIGKTRLLQEIRVLGQQMQMQAHVGRCYEDLALPYLPFVDSLLPRLASIAAERGEDAGELGAIAHLLHGARSAPATPASPGAGYADYEKLHLFLTVSHATVTLAQMTPTILLFDDLHWADRLSLDLLEHIIFTVVDIAMREPIPLLIVATHRPVEREDRLARLVARLQREETCRTLPLDGLSETEVRELIGGLGLARPSHQLTTTVSDATQGNPLFVQEVVHHLLREDALQEQGGYLVTTADASDLRLPEQVTGAIVTRARDLSAACHRVVTLGSFLGDNFSLRVLTAVSAMPEEDLLDLLEEGIRHRLLRGEGDGFQFAHPLIRHVYYQGPSAPRRQLLHKQIAESLQLLYAGSPDSHILEIAHHLVRAGSAVPPNLIVEHARRAADQAFQMSAWSDAAHYYEAASAAAESSRCLPAQEQADLQYWAGLARYHDQDVGPCLHHYERAIEGYRASGDVRGLARALMERTRTQYTLAAVPLGTLADLTPLANVLDALGETEPSLRGHIAAVMSEAYRTGRQPEKSRERAQQALAIGQELQDDQLCAYASFALGLALINGLHVREALAGWETALLHARRADDLIRESWTLHRMPLALTLLGRFDDGDAVALRACDFTRRSHDWSNYSLGLSHLASMAVARGHFDEAEERAHETMLMVSRSRYPWGGLRSLPALACARAMRGAWTEAEDALDVLVEPRRVFEDPGPIIRAFGRVFRQLVRAHADRVDGDVETLASDLMKVVGTDTYALAPLCALVELAQFVERPAIADLPVPALTRAIERGAVFSSGWMFLIPRVLGVAAAVNRRWDIADAHFRTALDVAATAGARPELGRTCLDYAGMLLAQDETGHRQRSLELLEQANSVFIQLGMLPGATRATQLAATLGVRLSSPPAPRAAYPDDLSQRDMDVLVRLAQGRSGQEIAGELVLGRNTVAAHVSRILDKTRVTSEAAAVAYAVERGLVPTGGHERPPLRTTRDAARPA